MIALLQRVSQAQVEVADAPVATIGPGALAFVGFHQADQSPQIIRLAERILNWRMFADADGKMNLSLRDTGRALLLVPQFTLAADTGRGRRASFSTAAAPDYAEDLFQQLLACCQQEHDSVASGVFGADMQVHLINDGPVTFILQP